MILSDRDIIKRIKAGSLLIDPFKEEHVQPSTVDLELCSKVRIFNNFELGVIDLRSREDPTREVEIGKKGFIIHPGEFLLGATKETFKIPLDLAAKIEGRSSLGRLGLIIHATAGYVDPGFSGEITFEISNISRTPIRIYPGMRIAQICFFQMTSKVQRPYGSKELGSKYQGQKGPTSSRVWRDFEK